jgi:predicted Holliday junction resolvase-like endonuclease
MIYLILGFIITIIILIVSVVILSKRLIHSRQKIKEMKIESDLKDKEFNDLLLTMKDFDNLRREADDLKKKLNTGNSVNDFNNSVDIVSNINNHSKSENS